MTFIIWRSMFCDKQDKKKAEEILTRQLTKP